MSMLPQRLLLLATVLAYPVAALAAESPFSISRLRASISIAEPPAGTTLEIDVEGLAPRNILGLHKCSEPCDHAKEVAAIVGNDDRARRHASFHVDEAGRHYLWMSQINGTGESGPVFVRSLKATAQGFHATFDDGSTVDAALVLPSEDAGAPPATKGKDRVEIVSVTPGSAPRGIESDFTLEIEVELATLDEGIVMVGFNNARPNSYAMVKTLPITRGPQRLTVHTRAMVVDWQDHGHFGVEVNMGPKAEGMTWRPLAGAEHEIPALP